MRIGIVISDPEDWTARAIRASLTRRGAESVFLDFSLLASSIGRETTLLCSGIDLLDLDCLVVRDLGRRGAQDVAFRFETLQILEGFGLAVINPPEAIARAANKFAATFSLQKSGVPTPKTIITTSLDEAIRALHELGRAVYKPLFGYKGRGILLLKGGDPDDERRLLEIIERQGLAYLQEFVASPSPRDIRAFVVGERVMGAIYRVAPAGQWISNLAHGGHPKPCALTPELEKLAVLACQATGTVYCGVDILETPDEPKFIEVNGTPSGKGIFEALGVDVTEAIAEYVVQHVGDSASR
jgi:tetrahydromethanopterin:alpha-L-glutamate ligase